MSLQTTLLTPGADHGTPEPAGYVPCRHIFTLCGFLAVTICMVASTVRVCVAEFWGFSHSGARPLSHRPGCCALRRAAGASCDRSNLNPQPCPRRSAWWSCRSASSWDGPIRRKAWYCPATITATRPAARLEAHWRCVSAARQRRSSSCLWRPWRCCSWRCRKKPPTHTPSIHRHLFEIACVRVERPWTSCRVSHASASIRAPRLECLRCCCSWVWCRQRLTPRCTGGCAQHFA